MTEPLVTSDDLALYLKDGTVNVARAELLIGDAQTFCENYVGLTDDMPTLPDSCAPVVARVAYVAYTSITQARKPPPGSMGDGQPQWQGVALTRQDEIDLERAVSSGGGGVGVFSISVLPIGYVLPAGVGSSGGYSGFDQYP